MPVTDRACRLGAPISAVAALGWIYLPLLPIALFVPVWWREARTRACAIAVVSTYFGVSTIWIVPGLIRFFDIHGIAAVGLWLAVVVVQVFPWALFWRANERQRTWIMVSLLLLLSIPPLTGFSVANPVMAAGLLLPGQGTVGLLATLALIVALSMDKRTWVIPAIAVAYYGIAGLPALKTVPGVTAIETSFAHENRKTGTLEYLGRQIGLAERAREGVNVYPESALGNINQDTIDIWRDRLPGASIALAGGVITRADGSRENVIMALSRREVSIVYQQRFLPPVAMWAPWRKDGFRNTWQGRGIVRVGGITYAPLICYEQLLVWPMVESAFHNPDAILAIGNLAYAVGTPVATIQRNAIYLWSRLYDFPAVVAFNEAVTEI